MCELCEDGTSEELCAPAGAKLAVDGQHRPPNCGLAPCSTTALAFLFLHVLNPEGVVCGCGGLGVAGRHRWRRWAEHRRSCAGIQPAADLSVCGNVIQLYLEPCQHSGT